MKKYYSVLIEKLHSVVDELGEELYNVNENNVEEVFKSLIKSISDLTAITVNFDDRTSALENLAEALGIKECEDCDECEECNEPNAEDELLEGLIKWSNSFNELHMDNDAGEYEYQDDDTDFSTDSKIKFLKFLKTL